MVWEANKFLSFLSAASFLLFQIQISFCKLYKTRKLAFAPSSSLYLPLVLTHVLIFNIDFARLLLYGYQIVYQFSMNLSVYIFEHVKTYLKENLLLAFKTNPFSHLSVSSLFRS